METVLDTAHYCVEQVDYSGIDLRDIVLPQRRHFAPDAPTRVRPGGPA
jgi:hypothetical protein